MMYEAPWLEHYGHIPKNLKYPDSSMYEYLESAANTYHDFTAYEFMGTKVSFSLLIEEIHECAKALRAIGIGQGDRVTICLPNIPQAVIMFYAINLIGGISNMIHPLSAEGEIEFYLNESGSVAAITLDAFFEKFKAARGNTLLKYLLITSIKDKLKPAASVVYQFTKGRKIKRIPMGSDIILWKDFLAKGREYDQKYKGETLKDDPAVILYSGGTTGITKGILLTNLNFNALSMQTAAVGDCLIPGNSMLSIMPIFHGFGLGIGIHTILTNGCKCILIPAFSAKTFGTLLKRNKPNYIAGVPTLYEALLRNEKVKGIDLSCLKGVFCGGDTLSIELKKKVDKYLVEHGADTQIREGYGMTESVTASCLTPKDFAKIGSIGIPFPDMLYKIVKPNTRDSLAYGEEGEICVHGPTVMIGYLGNPKETALVLQTHDDGRRWLHTGDLGIMDEEGFIYFRQRLKRMIISSGYSIYPSQLENIIESHEAVLMATVIGVDDPYKVQKIKAYVVLKPKIVASDAVKDSIWEHCEKNITRYAMPYEIEYRESLPMTLVGKVAYTVLEAEEREKNGAVK